MHASPAVDHQTIQVTLRPPKVKRLQKGGSLQNFRNGESVAQKGSLRKQGFECLYKLQTTLTSRVYQMKYAIYILMPKI